MTPNQSKNPRSPFAAKVFLKPGCELYGKFKEYVLRSDELEPSISHQTQFETLQNEILHNLAGKFTQATIFDNRAFSPLLHVKNIVLQVYNDVITKDYRNFLGFIDKEKFFNPDYIDRKTFLNPLFGRALEESFQWQKHQMDYPNDYPNYIFKQYKKMISGQTI